MNAISRLFLRAKHWQIFLLFMVLLIAGWFGLLGSLINATRAPQDFGKGLLYFEIPTVINMVCILLWLWSMGSFLSSRVETSLRQKMGFFRFALIYPVPYVFAFLAVFLNPAPIVFAIIFPLHCFAMFCLFYDLYFVSKSLVLAETGKPVTFYDFAGPFFLLWIYFVGVWLIQPRINRLYANAQHQSLVP
jgi:hypothetical protein